MCSQGHKKVGKLILLNKHTYKYAFFPTLTWVGRPQISIDLSILCSKIIFSNKKKSKEGLRGGGRTLKTENMGPRMTLNFYAFSVTSGEFC